MTSGITEILREDTVVQALLGFNGAGTKYKVYPVIAPQKEEPPFITVYQQSNDAVTSLSKDFASELDYPRVVITCWDRNFRPTELLGEAVRLAMDNKSFDTDAGYQFARLWVTDEREGFDAAALMYCHILTFAAEIKRVPGDVLQTLINEKFMSWAGTWVWAAHANVLPTEVKAGRTWITGDDRGNIGEENYYPAGTLMIAKSDGANDFEDFKFIL